ncbi:hydrogenase nickel incorporation protein HypB [Magnetospirillum sp. 64-120]|uniref:hydrogenase nickel incorporation protein HypB n=1 Tax=Magnetospirillum sp. 64-120 TaxID=1895778 RepID=UPI0009260E7F|nr:hydrogenase nickel incorporation protein HypB [Magnetospirillum sp. 64-120]OJX70530.1 MAG: hydrogenase accessory protein HypB [Magnetospirillum sp. 64-120]
MCTVCGCGDAKVEHSHDHDHHHPHDHDHHHDHDHGHGHGHHHHHHGDDLHFGQGIAGVHVPGLSQSRIIQIEQDILGHNKSLAEVNRAWLAERGIFALNLVSSPGSGKTTLLCKTVEDLAGRFPVSVIEGDQQTSNDADRIRATGAPAVQVNTGKGCHLDAHMVATAFGTLKPAEDSVLFIENVGNLVCPAAFDLGEAYKVAILSVTEGEDKPLKYPDMFAAASMMILTKVDLLPHLDFDVAKCIDYARRVNPEIVVLQVSAKTGQGMDEWLAWVAEGRRQAIAAKVAGLKAKLVAAEAALSK